MTVDPPTAPPPRGAMPVIGPLLGAVDDLVQAARTGEETAWILAAANLGFTHVTLRLPIRPPRRAVLLSSTDPDRLGGEVDPDRFILLPNEVVLLSTPADAPIPSSPSPMPPRGGSE